MLLCVLLAVIFAATAKAAQYKMVVCSGDNGAVGYSTATNTTSAQNPGGIFAWNNYCYGAGNDPPGESAFLRISENQNSGNAGNGAYGDIIYDTPAYTHFKAAGGYTREPNAFNEGWRARFWGVDFNNNGFQIFTQGLGLGLTSTFAPHLWPGGDSDFHRFVFELECVRPAGCDRSNYNATDLNGIVFILNDDSNSQVALTNTSSALLQGNWVRGTQEVDWNSSDLGSGLRDERLRVDNSEPDRIDEGCNVTGSAANGAYARTYQPCPTGGPYGRAYGLDTTQFSDGGHYLSVCTQDYGQYVGLNGTGGETCDARTIHVDNTPPGAPTGLSVLTPNPARYTDHFGATFSLPPNSGSPIAKVHYNIVNAANEVVVPEQVLSGTNPTEVANIAGPKAPGDYRLRAWLEDGVGLTGPAATVPIPHDTTPPAAPQDVSVTPPTTSRASDGFDLRWRDIVDAGSPIDAVHYQVLDASGAVVVPTQTVYGQSVQSIANLDTPDDRGDYTLRLWLSDAEGNVGAPVSAPLTYDCLRSQVAGGLSLSAGFGPSGAGEEVVQEGNGSIVSGALHGVGGSPTASAPLCVFSRVVTDPGREFEGVAITGRDGSYKFPVEPGPSRQMSVIYRPDNRELSAQATIQTVVHPTFKVGRNVVSNKHLAHFFGEIPGPHNDQVVVVLQVKSGKGWRAFRRYRTRDGGKYSVGYRFNHTNSPTKYVMRAQVRATTGYPYLEGNSDQLGLKVLPTPPQRRR